jgi:lipopolysaccharide transport protein LptA
MSAHAVEKQRRQAFSSDEPISLDAASWVADGKTNTTAFKDIVISQGDTKVQAEHAQMIGATNAFFENSRWTFQGNVRIHAEERGNLHSDQAVVEFRNNRISKAIVTGTPAEFEQKRSDSDLMARGRADQIVYDVSQGTVRLTDEAWLSDGLNEMSGPLLVYNIREQRVEASSSSPETSGGRVHIIIGPRDPGKNGSKQAPPGGSGAGAGNPSGANGAGAGTPSGANGAPGSPRPAGGVNPPS